MASRFVPSFLAPLAYQDTPLPIGFDKAISQPFIVALMTDLLGPEPHDSILEVGTGLGYQAAVLAELSGRVWSVEIVEELAGQAEANLRQLGCSDVAIRIGDGSRGWREHAPYDRALLTAAAERLPPAILDQIKPGGRVVLPLGPDEAQWLTVVDKGADGQTSVRQLIPVRFSRLETVVSKEPTAWWRSDIGAPAAPRSGSASLAFTDPPDRARRRHQLDR